MSSQGSATKQKQPAKPRTSIRSSLNLSSVGKTVGKALADKAGRRSSRRQSAIHIGPDAPDGRARLTEGKRTPTPDASRTITRATRSSFALPRQSTSSDEFTLVDSGEPPQATIGLGHTRSASLRPVTRSQTAIVSALPKYKLKSLILEEVREESSPTKPNVRRPRSTAPEETGAIAKASPGAMGPPLSTGKQTRAISPVPHRGALKVNLTGAINVTPTKTGNKEKGTLSLKGSPPSTSKTARFLAGASALGTSIPRPSSAKSSASSPRTPKTPLSAASSKGFPRVGRDHVSQSSTPSRGSGRSESPAEKRPSKVPLCQTPTPSPRKTKAADSSMVGDNSEDDIILLLAPVASPTAPTPAMPRILRSADQFPSQPALQLPPAVVNPKNQSSLSPERSPVDSSSLLRPPNVECGYGPRASILSWEQLAGDSSFTLKEDELDKMLSDMPAPFPDGPSSPPPSAPRSPLFLRTDLDSPGLSRMNSPAGYGSISQVLLPDATPSPAVRLSSQRDYADFAPEIPIVDAAIVTLLRLQLASAEASAQERSKRVSVLEEEIRLLKERRVREVEELGGQVSTLEERLRESIEMRGRSEEERAAYVGSLEDQLRHAHAYREDAIRGAVEASQRAARTTFEQTFQARRWNWELACAAGNAGTFWASARDQAESELELVRSNKEMLSVLLAGLDHASQVL